MNKKQIKDEIAETRKRLQALEAKLQEPEKWQPKGLGQEFLFCPRDGVIRSADEMFDSEAPFRNKNFEEAKALAKYLKNQALLWQLANELNEGWVPDWGDGAENKFSVYFRNQLDEWIWHCHQQNDFMIPVFKNSLVANVACDILNNQETGVEL